MRLAFLIFGSIVLKDSSISAESLRGISYSQPHTSQPTVTLRQVGNSSASEAFLDSHKENKETAAILALSAIGFDQLRRLEQFSSTVLTSTMRTGDLRLSAGSTPVPEGFWKISSKMIIPLQCPLSGSCLGTCLFEFFLEALKIWDERYQDNIEDVSYRISYFSFTAYPCSIIVTSITPVRFRLLIPRSFSASISMRFFRILCYDSDLFISARNQPQI